MFLAPVGFARLGLLVLNDGQWRDRRIIAADYVAIAAEPSPANGCYGFLFWTNTSPCIGPTFPSRKISTAAPVEGMPADAYAMVGFLQ